ncbi:MAG: NEW3 domain-containing protein [Pseudomonadota bacterium]
MLVQRVGIKDGLACLACLLCLVPSAVAGAGAMVLENTVTCASNSSGVAITVAVLNQGDETAHEVRVEARYPGADLARRTLERIEPGSSRRAEWLVQPPPARPGAYPVLVYIDFKDEAGRDYSALAHGEIIAGERVNSNVAVKTPAVELGDSAQVALGLVNWDDEAHEAAVRLAVPREFETGGVQRVRISPLAETTVVFELKNKSAPPGAVYPSVLFVEYDFRDRRMLARAEVGVRVVPAEAFFKRRRFFLFFFGLALLAAAAVVQALSGKKSAGRRIARDG